MPARICISSNEFANDAAKAFEVARRFGIRWMEVWVEAPWDRKAIIAEAPTWKAAGVGVACISSWSQLNKEDWAQGQVLETIEIAGAIGCPFVNTYFGINAALGDDDAIASYRKRLDPCLRLAARHGVTLLLENEFDTDASCPRHEFTGRAANCLRLFEAIGAPNFGLTYDPCNFYIAGEEAFPFAYELLRKHIRYIHVKNACRQDDALYGPKKPGHHASGDCTYVPAPDGAVNILGLLDRLHRDRYDGFLCLEPHDTRDLMGNIERSLAMVRGHAIARES